MALVSALRDAMLTVVVTNNSVAMANCHVLSLLVVDR